ncbi:hypothetical protein CAEBREN_22340 [Caenorhabditis brenneri]|uniref:Uncharacterized protein n=1 Tax=Caenorhabditis brenneri TaxID=135651 RepID=G0MC52_CAEBE|nr:hypothetical protein CAEBREN_22340 [Caenorhabditis brenneri]
MKVYIETIDVGLHSFSFSNMFYTVNDAFFDNLHHSIFSLILFVAYIFKLSKGQIFQIVHCIFHMEKLKKPYNIDIYTFSAYYFVFFWIVSVYITNCKFMRKYIDSDTIENPYVETEMEEVSDTAQQKF